jgi:restriction endonuclease Mrr
LRNKDVRLRTSEVEAEPISPSELPAMDTATASPGSHLAELMIDHGVGVTLRPEYVPKLDDDYFEE